MKNFLNKIAAIYNKTVHSTLFILILSIIVGVFGWIYIISIVNPSKTAEYTKIPVKIEMSGSIPEYYGLSILSGTPSVSVNVNVEGSRTGLMRFNKDKINAYLDMSSVTNAGGYNLNIVVKSNDPEVRIVSYEPMTLFCEFDTSTTKIMDVKLELSGQLSSGYVIKDSSISPTTVEISGPTSVVSTITSVTLGVNLTGKTDAFSGTETLNFKNSNNDNVNKSVLTLSSENASYNFDIVYARSVVPRVRLFNSYGGDESKYMNVEYSPNAIMLEGDEFFLTNLTDLLLGAIPTDQMLTNRATFNLPIPTNTAYTVSGSTGDTVTVTVTYDSDFVSMKTFVFDKDDIDNFLFINKPDNTECFADVSSIRLSVRGIKSVLDTLKTGDIVATVDMSSPNSEGEYPVDFKFPSDLSSYGLLNRVFVSVVTNEIDNGN